MAELLLEDEDDILRPIPGLSIPCHQAPHVGAAAKSKSAVRPHPLEEESTQEDEDFEADTEPYFTAGPESRPPRGANCEEDEGSQTATLPYDYGHHHRHHMEERLAPPRTLSKGSAGSALAAPAARGAKLAPSSMHREKENRRDYPNSPALTATEPRPYVLVKATPTPSLPQRKFAAAAAASASAAGKPTYVTGAAVQTSSAAATTNRRGLRVLDSPYQSEAKAKKARTAAPRPSSSVSSSATTTTPTTSSSASVRLKPTPCHQSSPPGPAPCVQQATAAPGHQLHQHQQLLALPLPTPPGSPSHHFRQSPGSLSPTPTSPSSSSSSRSQSPSASPSASPSRCFRLFPFGGSGSGLVEESVERDGAANNTRKRKITDGTAPQSDTKRTTGREEEAHEDGLDDLSHVSFSICSPAPLPTAIAGSSLTVDASTPSLQRQFTDFHSPFISPVLGSGSSPSPSPSSPSTSPVAADRVDATRKRCHPASSPQISPASHQPDDHVQAGKRSRLALDTRKRLDFSDSAATASGTLDVKSAPQKGRQATTPTKQSSISRFLVAKKKPQDLAGAREAAGGAKESAVIRKSSGPAATKRNDDKTKTTAIDLLDDTIEVDDDFEPARPRSSATTTTTTSSSSSSSSSSLRRAASSAAFTLKPSGKALEAKKERAPVQPGWIRRIADERKPTANRETKRVPRPIPFLDRSAKSQSSPPELINARKEYKVRPPDRRAETQIDLDGDGDSESLERGESEAQASGSEDDIDSSWDEENSAALFLEKDLVGDRRIKNRVKKSMKELKPLPKSSSSTSSPLSAARKFQTSKSMNDVITNTTAQATAATSRSGMSSSASSASLFSTFSRPTSLITSGKRSGKSAEGSQGSSEGSGASDEGVIGDLYTSIQVNAELEAEAEQPPLLKLSLLKYQRQGLAWMVDKEDDGRATKGGILADAMGLGKTIQMLSLILQNVAKPGAPCKTTLIVCPLSMLDQWLDEIRNRVKGSRLQVNVYYGNNRIKDANWLKKCDVVLTTYGTLAAEFVTRSKGKNARASLSRPIGCLESVPWHRIVLDEAHLIKNAGTRTCKAVCSMQADRRWCLTGTPIQNSLEDVYSLLHFLRVENFNDPWWWNLMIIKPIRRNDSTGFVRLQTVMLRRTREHRIDGQPIVSLPPCKIVQKEIEFSPMERQFYDTLFKNAQSVFNDYLENNTVLNHYVHILELLLRLRQCCNHYFIVLMCLTMPALRTTRPTLEGLKDEYRRIMRLLELKKAGKQNSQEDDEYGAEEEKEGDIQSKNDGGQGDGDAEGVHTPTRKRSSATSTVSLTPTRRNGVFDLPVPLLADILTPAANRRAGRSTEAAGAGETSDEPAQICSICFNGLEDNVAAAPCGHQFCRECIDDYWETEYAGENMGHCPVQSCRHRFSIKKLQAVEANSNNRSDQQQARPSAHRRLDGQQRPKPKATMDVKTAKRRQGMKLEFAGLGRTKSESQECEAGSEGGDTEGDRDDDESERALAVDDDDDASEASEREALKKPPGRRLDGSDTGHTFMQSSKVSALMEEVRRMRQEDPTSKCLIFSQFTMCLDLIELSLHSENVEYTRLDGSMTKAHRVSEIARFKADPSVAVFLISLKTGNCGLNLIHASHIFLMDPWWNPSAEQQAIDRAHRLGQVRPVTVIRFIIRDSIEERILDLQDRKRRIAQGAFAGGGHEGGQSRGLALSELRQLFER